MQTNRSLATRTDERGVDPWLLLSGNSAGLVAGFAVDLVRLGLHRVRRAWAAPGAGAPRCTSGCG